MKHLAGLLIFGALAIGQAQALEIIHDAGNAVPSAQYLAQLFTVDVDDPDSKPTGLNFVTFPIRTDSMKPGALSAAVTIKQPAWLVQPVFIIGADVQSKAWLKRNLIKLQQLNAIGIVASVDSYADFRALQNAAPGVALAPASADGLGASLGIAVYPALVQTSGEVSQ